MKTINLLALSALLTTTASADIIISEYIEGGSYNKAIELFNPSNADVDLSQYQLEIYFNGKTAVGNTINLNGTLSASGTYVIAHNKIDATATVNFYAGSLLHNGDDAIVLKKNGVVIDSLGKIGQDPGSEWGAGLTSTKDNTLVRMASILQGDTNPNDDFDPSEQWIGFENNTLSNLGVHTANDNGDNGDNGSGGDDSGDNGSGDNTDNNSECGQAFTAISAIQGSGLATPISNQMVWTEGVVTHTLQDSGYKGFFLQSADSDIDNDDNTSEGIFVYHQADNVAVGNRVRLKAKANEYKNLTQLSNVESFSLCQQTAELPSSKTLSLPMNDEQKESLEGMRIVLNNTVVTDTYNYGRYGQFEVATQRLYTPTQIVEPGAAANELALENAAKSILIDDGETAQNPELLPAPAPELTTINTLRSGDTLPTIEGIFSYHFNNYQIFSSSPLLTQTTNLRPVTPNIETLGNLRVASFNVLNYFNGDGQGGGFPTARGAKTAEEFDRQRNKIIAAIASMDADIIGLMEIENDGYGAYSAIADLTAGINSFFNAQIYSYVMPNPALLGTDEIAVGLIYKSEVVMPAQAAKVLNSANSPTDINGNSLFLDSKNRPMVSQLFTHLLSNKQFVVAVNHLKSKGSDCDSLGDYDKNDGQGNCNITRTKAANAAGQFLQNEYNSIPTLIIGDMNAYLKEDPIKAFANNGFNDIFSSLGKTATYSYLYDGQMGQLDHALANSLFTENVVDVTAWAINADEPRVLDYSMQNQNNVHHTKFYAPDAYRSSDHDPIVVEVLLKPTAVFGDLDLDSDVDSNDLTLFLQRSANGELTDLAYDFNGDNLLNRRDVRGFMQLCTRTRCATE